MVSFLMIAMMCLCACVGMAVATGGDVGGPFAKLRQRIKILRIAAKLVKSGDIVQGMSPDEMTQVIAAAMLEEDPDMYGAPGFDWAALIALIIQMLPLILALFGL